jgi:aspartate aminotransferase-like enzyme
LSVLAEVKKNFPDTLLCVDTVASAGGAPVAVDENLIDLSLNGSQKALSAPPSMSFVAVSPAAWERIEQIAYVGYDAFLPFKDAQRDFYFPNTPYWHGVSALNAAAELILEEGLENVFKRHQDCMALCHQRINSMGLSLFPKADAMPAPTVTAVYMPKGYTWAEFNKICREKGLAIAGSYGALAGKVFRIGHMGNQARIDDLEAGLDLLQTIV